jgi:hypothetical protein
MPCVTKVKMGNENVKALATQTGEKPKGSVPIKIKSFEWAILSPDL